MWKINYQYRLGLAIRKTSLSPTCFPVNKLSCLSESVVYSKEDLGAIAIRSRGQGHPAGFFPSEKRPHWDGRPREPTAQHLGWGPGRYQQRTELRPVPHSATWWWAGTRGDQVHVQFLGALLPGVAGGGSGLQNIGMSGGESQLCAGLHCARGGCLSLRAVSNAPGCDGNGCSFR